MRIKFYPCKWNPYSAPSLPECTLPNTVFEAGDNTITVDGDTTVFPLDGIEWPSIAVESCGLFVSARREQGILYLEMRLFYTDQPSPLCDGEWHTYGEDA